MMKGLQDAKLPPEFTQPALVGVVVILVTCALLFLTSSLKVRRIVGSSTGTKYVKDEIGGPVVRRSTRSAKKPERWEPEMEETSENDPSPLKAVEKAVSRAVRTPRNAVKEIKEKLKSEPEETPTTRPRGRPRKSDTEKQPKSPRYSKTRVTSSSPPRTRRVKSPKS